MGGQTLSVLTLNMRYGAGPHAADEDFLKPRSSPEVRKNLDDIAVLIRSYDPDIVCLQEVDHKSTRTAEIAQAQYLADACGYPHVATAENIHIEATTPLWRWGRNLYGKLETSDFAKKYLGFEKGHVPDWPMRLTYGNATLCRYPFTYEKNHHFTPLRWRSFVDLFRMDDERKSYLECKVASPVGDLYVVNTHLDCKNIVLRTIEGLHLSHYMRKRRDTPCILAGDFNAEPLGSRHEIEQHGLDTALERLMRSEHVRYHDSISPDAYPLDENGRHIFPRELMTHPPLDPERLIDAILVNKHFEYESYEVINAAVSDHRPVFARLRLDKK